MDIITYLDDMNALVPSIILLSLGVLGGVAWLVLGSLKTRRTIIKEPDTRLDEVKGGDEQKVDDKKPTILGTGTLPCYVITDREVKSSFIPKPIGYVFTADPSMSGIGPVGACYLVQEALEGDVIPFDPREELYDAKKSPQYAFFATHWDVAREVFKVASPWWQSAPLWVTVVVLVLLAFAMLIFGG